MKKLLIIIFLYAGAFNMLTAQQSFEIQIDSEDDCKVIEATTDDIGNVILVGDIGPFVGHDLDAFAMKVCPDGSFITKRVDMQDTISVFTQVEVLANGNYFVVGSYSITGDYLKKKKLWVVIMDQNLKILDQKSFLIRSPYIGFGATANLLTDNDGNILTAMIALTEDGSTETVFCDLAFYKFNQSGDTLLSKYYSYMWSEYPYEFLTLPNSEDVMLIEQSTHYNGHQELMFLDTEFNILNINNFFIDDSPLINALSSDIWLSDDSFLLSGTKTWDMGPYTEFYIGVYEVDTSASFSNELVLNKTDTIDYTARRSSMACANDTTIYIGGFQNYIEFWPITPSIVELYMIDKDLNLLGYKELGGDYFYEVWGIIATADDGCLIYGTKHDSPEPERDVHIWKVLRDEINIITEVSETDELTENITVFPNPATDQVSIQLGAGQNWDQSTISVFTLTGKKVFQQKIVQQGNLLQMDIRNLERGTYVMQITGGNGGVLESEKVVKK